MLKLSACELDTPSTQGLSENGIILTLGGCGTTGPVHPNVKSILEQQGLKVINILRKGDIEFSKSLNATEIYIEEIIKIVDFYESQGKKVYVWSNSFGSYLIFKASEKLGEKISGIISIAPVVNPGKSIRFLKKSEDDSGITLIFPNDFFISTLNMDYLDNNPARLILPPSLVVLSKKDGIIDISELDQLSGLIEKIILENERHGETTASEKTRSSTTGFLQKILATKL